MRLIRFASLLLIAAAFVITVTAGAQAELRFGPWVYWAPYYYPSPEKMRMLGFHTKDFAPRYQEPNPIAPKSDGYVPPPPPIRKVAARSPRRVRMAPPSTSAPQLNPRPVPTRPSSLRKPTISRQPAVARSSQPTAPGSTSRQQLRWGSRERPQAVGSHPGR